MKNTIVAAMTEQVATKNLAVFLSERKLIMKFCRVNMVVLPRIEIGRETNCLTILNIILKKTVG